MAGVAVLLSQWRNGRLRSAYVVGHPHWVGGANIRREPAVVSVSHLVSIHLGLDVHKDTISVGISDPDQQPRRRADHLNIGVGSQAFVARFPDRARLRACYEAGPTGFELARLLHRMDVRCEVIAPSLIPRAPGDKVKTDRRGLPAAGPVAPAPASWSPSASPPSGGGGAGPVPHPRRHGRRPHQGTNRLGSSCCAMGGHGGWGRPGPMPTRRGCGPSGSTSRR